MWSQTKILILRNATFPTAETTYLSFNPGFSFEEQHCNMKFLSWGSLFFSKPDCGLLEYPTILNLRALIVIEEKSDVSKNGMTEKPSSCNWTGQKLKYLLLCSLFIITFLKVSNHPTGVFFRSHPIKMNIFTLHKSKVIFSLSHWYVF